MRICPNCASENADSALFCVSCGSSLKSAHTRQIPVSRIRELNDEIEKLKTEELFDDPDVTFDQVDEAMEFERQIRRYKREQGPINTKLRSRKARKEDKKIVLIGVILILAVLSGGIIAFNLLPGSFSGNLSQRTSNARLSDDMIKELTREKEAEKDLPGTGENETAVEENPGESEEAAEQQPVKQISASIMKADELDNKGYSRVTIASAEASSVIDQPGFDNSPIRAADGNENTSWQEGVDGPGIGESIDYIFDQQYNIHSMTFKLGVWSSESYYWKNNRPATMTIWFDDNGFEVTFPDGKEEFALLFDEDIPATSVHIEINSVYKGSEYDDTCITDIGIYGA